MAKLSELIKVKDDVVFGGAVQVDWFYQEKAKVISENFVFHGPDFFGVTEGEVEFTDHKLMDTCSYAKLISDKLTSEIGNPLMLTIAGYGTGKSHMAVTLGKLFENRDQDIVNRIMNNLRSADTLIADQIKSNNDKKNLVLVLNGMKDFNLNIEILRASKKVISSYGYSDDFFSDITKAYTIAKIFIERNYSIHKAHFSEEFFEYNKSGNELYTYMLDSIFNDDVFNRINNVYEKINGTRIRWDEGITASEILKKLNERLCGDNGEFNKILILFDEFGRYIEFAANRPELAGDSALQQIYETIQDSNNSIILVGFIQSDLKTYMARVKKSSSIARYIGRYESGEKLYLSSNLETIFANLISRKDDHLYREFIFDNLKSDENASKYETLYRDINSWSLYASTKGVWKDEKKFNDILVLGIYPMNPLSVLLLTNLSDWYQQRSALNFFMDSIETISEKNVDKLGELPEIYATDIIQGDLFTELLLAEKEGRQRSENCMMFERILVKHGEKLIGQQERVLSSILVFKLLKLRVSSKNELLRAFLSLAGINGKIIESCLDTLENNIGVIVYDNNRHTYDFVEDATGQNDFNAHFNRVRNRLDFITMESLVSGEVKSKLGLLSDMQTDFAKVNNIKTNEWSYRQEIRTTNEMDESYFKSLCDDLKNSTQVTSTRGVFVYVYISENDSYENVVQLYNRYNLETFPVVMWLLDDNEQTFYNTLLNEKIIGNFSKEEAMKYSRFIDKFLENNIADMKQVFKILQGKREIITEKGVVNTDKRMKVVLKEKFEVLYTDVIPFPFEGFTNKQLSTPKKNLCLISKSMLAGALNYSWIQVQDKGMRNIVTNVLVNQKIGWGVLNEKYEMQYPTNRNLYKLFISLDKEFEKVDKLSLMSIYKRCVAAPIGMNDYSFALLLSIYMKLKGIEAKIIYKDKITKNVEWSTLFYKDKSIDLKVLDSSSIIKVNIEGYLKKYQVLCNEIEHETNIARFGEIVEKLRCLELENEPPEELLDRVQTCHMRLEIGLNQLRNFQNKIISIHGDFNKGTTDRLDFKYVLSAMIRGKHLIENEREESGHFDIPNSEIDKLDLVQDKGRVIIEAKYMNYIKNQNCMSVSNVGPYRKWLERLAENLKELGYGKYAAETIEHMEETTGNLKNIRKIQDVVEKCDTFVKVTKPTKYSNQEELLSLDREVKTLLELIQQNKVIDSRTRDNYEKKLGVILNQVGEYLDKIKVQITEIYDKAFEIKTIDEAEDIKNRINDVLEKGIRHDEKEYIMIIGKVITSCLSDINDVRINNTLAFRSKRIKDLKLKYEEYEDDVDLNNMLDNYLQSIEVEIKKENDYWITSHEFDYKEMSETWNAQKCQSYLKSTDLLPDFLNENSINGIHSKRESVIIKMKELKIDSVVEMFKSLSSQEKKDCIKLLNSYVN